MKIVEKVKIKVSRKVALHSVQWTPISYETQYGPPDSRVKSALIIDQQLSMELDFGISHLH